MSGLNDEIVRDWYCDEPARIKPKPKTAFDNLSGPERELAQQYIEEIEKIRKENFARLEALRPRSVAGRPA